MSVHTLAVPLAGTRLQHFISPDGKWRARGVQLPPLSGLYWLASIERVQIKLPSRFYFEIRCKTEFWKTKILSCLSFGKKLKYWNFNCGIKEGKKLWSRNIYMKVQKRALYVHCEIIFNTDIYIGVIIALRKSSYPQMPQKCNFRPTNTSCNLNALDFMVSIHFVSSNDLFQVWLRKATPPYCLC